MKTFIIIAAVVLMVGCSSVCRTKSAANEVIEKQGELLSAIFEDRATLANEIKTSKLISSEHRLLESLKALLRSNRAIKEAVNE